MKRKRKYTKQKHIKTNTNKYIEQLSKVSFLKHSNYKYRSSTVYKLYWTKQYSMILRKYFTLTVTPVWAEASWKLTKAATKCYNSSLSFLSQANTLVPCNHDRTHYLIHIQFWDGIYSLSNGPLAEFQDRYYPMPRNQQVCC